MPKVIIAEKDLKSAPAIQYDDHIVLIPGTGLVKGVALGEEKYFTSASDFAEAAGKVNTEWTSDVTLKTVYRLLELGMTVLYRVITGKSELEKEDFWKQYEDKGIYNLRFLTCGSYPSILSAQLMIKCAAERGDAIALVDIPTDLVEVKMNLTGIEVDGTVSVTEGEFDTSNLIITKTFKAGDYTEYEVASENTSFTFDPEEPSSEVGAHTVKVTGHYTDAGNAEWTDEKTMEYEIGANETQSE